MIVSLCPTFYCNQRCNYCFLGELRNNNSFLDIDKMKEIFEILSENTIEYINIFGGEISLLPREYLIEMNDLCKQYCKHISVTTNMTNDISDIFDNISYSLNEERQDYKKVSENILYSENNYSLSIVLLPSIIKKSPFEILNEINHYNCKNVTFQKYSPAKLAIHNYSVTDEDYEETLKKIIDYYIENRDKFYYNISNVDDIKDCLEGYFNPLMEENVFINYKGQYGAIAYDNNLEYFKWFDNYSDWKNETVKEKEIYKRCSSCPYYSHCYAEHLNLNKSCSGHKSLLDYYKGKI